MLELYFLPPYSPELNPTELVWNQAKNHRLGREVITSKDDLKKRVIAVLRPLQRMPGLLLSFFRGFNVRYALG